MGLIQKIMNPWSGALSGLALTIASCNSNPFPQRTKALNPGTYAGNVSCFMHVQEGADVIQSIPYDSEIMITIGKAGIPLNIDGYQLAPGVSESVHIGDISGVARVRSAYIDSSSGCFFANLDVFATLESGGKTVEISGIGSEAYCPSHTGSNGFDYGLDYFLAPEGFEELQAITFEARCDGIDISPVGE